MMRLGRNAFWTRVFPRVAELIPPKLVNELRNNKYDLAMLVTLAVLAVKVRGAKGNVVMVVHKTIRNTMCTLLKDNNRRVRAYACIVYVLSELCDAKLLETYGSTARGKVYLLRRGMPLWQILEQVKDTETLLEAYRQVREIIRRSYMQ